MKTILKKYKPIILYIFFGVLTTLINIAVYEVCYIWFHVPNVPSNIAAWVLAVGFAFITNKLYVFESREMVGEKVIKELLTFVGARVTTGLVDLAIMFLGVDVLKYPSLIFKISSNVLVIILNYILSKLVVFKKK